MTTGQAEGLRQRRAISLATARQAIADHDGGGPRRRIEDSGRDIISMSVEKPGFAITRPVPEDPCPNRHRHGMLTSRSPGPAHGHTICNAAATVPAGL